MPRGDIYHIAIPSSVGNEIYKDRPGVIVGLGDNYARGVVQVVFCTASPKPDEPAHVTVRETPRVSTALCNQLYTVDVSRLSNYVGHCSDAEMSAIDIALACVLGLDLHSRPLPAPQPAPPVGDSAELIQAKAEAKIYKKLYADMLERALGVKS